MERVIVAGAGPVGCVAALALARAGVPVVLLEAEAELPLDLRGSTFHPPTLDMLDDLGVVERLIGEGIVCPVWQHRDRSAGVVAEWDLALLRDDTRHPYRVQAEQYKLTRIIAEELKRFPHVSLRYRARATGVQQDADGVDVAIETPDGPETLRGAYLIAADGASSVIRRAIGIEFPGLTFPELWLCASTPYEFTRHFDKLAPIAYVADPEEWFVFVKVPGLWRLLLPTAPGETAADIVKEPYVQMRMQRVCPTGRDYALGHVTAYAVHQRVATSYRKGRVLLAGDAAHINNPLGGMGMNGGIHDAMNLSEKLAGVLRGETDAGVLDRYDRQRRPVAVEYVQSATLRNKAILEEKDPAVRRARQDDLKRTAADPIKARAFLLQSSMIDAVQRAAALA
ncbi:MAG TPA: FAD-dependent monooxygenase [Alphaproteobacteria bacterium]